MRPTGRLHLGNYVGALENWVRLQEQYQSHFLVADWHALTTDLEGTREYAANTREMVIDWIAAGIDPVRSPIFVQSQVKQHAELHLIFSMLITTARLERNPTLKDQVRDLDLETRLSVGHLAYPVLQSADILIYKGDVVPVGEDQLPHVEVTRELARRFNNVYCPQQPIFPEPDPLVTEFPRLPGLDGNKMSKSLGNTIQLADAPDEVRGKLRRAITDPQKIRKGDPGRPDVCLVFTYHKKFNADATSEIRSGCESGALGCVECKQRCADRIASHLEPIRVKRAEIESKPGLIDEILADGNSRARSIAAATMDEVHAAMGFG
ncbi:tryptophan--tRNA ligase [candidate division KSB1 bacterium]|nr:tryptophan--tRNA ligase [candidate division KSB1 bacterium]